MSEADWRQCEVKRNSRIAETRGATPGQRTTHAKREPKDVWLKKLYCECGSSFRRNRWHKNKYKEWSYGYICYNQVNNGSARRRREAGLDNDGYCDMQTLAEWKMDAMGKLLLATLWGERREAVQLACRMLRDCACDEPAEQGGLKRGVLSQIAKAERKIENLIEMRAEGEISKEEFLRQRAKLDGELKALQAELQTEPETAPRKAEGLAWKAIEDTLNQLIDFSGPALDKKLYEKFVSKVIPRNNNRFAWIMNLDNGVTAAYTLVTEGRKASQSISLANPEGDNPSLHQIGVIYLADFIQWREEQKYSPGPFPLIQQTDKQSIADYRITYGDDSPSVVAAAELLGDTLREITGEAFAVERANPADSDRILVTTATGYGADGYEIGTDKVGIVIAGGQRGVLYGVHRFLEEYFDCRWYTSELIVIPRGPAEIAEVKNERYIPPFEHREMDWLSRSDPVYSVANGLNGNIYRTLSEEQGGTFGYNGSFAHTFFNQFLKPEEFFEEHPEWYALRGGERVPRQPCLTNPEVLTQVIFEVRELLANGNGQPIVSVTQDDNQDYCQCPGCRAVDDEEGSHAGTMIRFVNAIANDIKDDYPDALIDTFAYQYTRKPPAITRSLPNVIVRLCSIECCFAHPLDAPGCSYNEAFARDIRAWSETCDRLYIWDYTTNYGHYNCIFPNFGVLQANMRFFAAHNVKGIYEEGNYTSHESNSEFAQLRGYLLARLLFNPGIDYGAEMDGFLQAYYGGGWQYMREFIDFTARNAGTKRPHRKLGIFNKPTDKDLLRLRPNQVAYADALWAKAIELAGSDACEQNVLRSQLSWRFWKGCNDAGEFSRLQRPRKWMAANEVLYGDFKAFGITRYSEGWSETDFRWRFLPEPPGNWLGRPDSWRG